MKSSYTIQWFPWSTCFTHPPSQRNSITWLTLLHFVLRLMRWFWLWMANQVPFSILTSLKVVTNITTTKSAHVVKKPHCAPVWAVVECCSNYLPQWKFYIGIPWEFLDFCGFNFRDFGFTTVYNSILFSSPLVLLGHHDLRGFCFCGFLFVPPH